MYNLLMQCSFDVGRLGFSKKGYFASNFLATLFLKTGNFHVRKKIKWNKEDCQPAVVADRSKALAQIQVERWQVCCRRNMFSMAQSQKLLVPI